MDAAAKSSLADALVFVSPHARPVSATASSRVFDSLLIFHTYMQMSFDMFVWTTSSLRLLSLVVLDATPLLLPCKRWRKIMHFSLKREPASQYRYIAFDERAAVN